MRILIITRCDYIGYNLVFILIYLMFNLQELFHDTHDHRGGLKFYFHYRHVHLMVLDIVNVYPTSDCRNIILVHGLDVTGLPSRTILLWLVY